MSTIEESLRALLEKVTRAFVREKERADREGYRMGLKQQAIRRLREREAVKQQKVTIKAAAWAIMKQAYMLVSDNGRLSANARQIMYAARRLVLKTIGKSWANDNAFTQGFLPDYMLAHPKETSSWDVVFDARGHFAEPHSRKSIGIGTLNVRSYIQSWTTGRDVNANVQPPEIDGSFPTNGPTNRFKYALFCEKEGFSELLAQSQIAERYDMAIFSSKGESTMAARQLADELSRAGVTVLVLHDLDKYGLLIAHWLSRDSPRYQFKSPPKIIDLGLRLADVKKMGLDTDKEPLVYKQKKNPGDVLRDIGVPQEEIDFLVGKQTDYKHWDGFRVELNALTSRQFIDFLEAKFKEHGVEKLVPDRRTLEIAWRRAKMVEKVNAAVEAVMQEISANGSEMRAPRDLAKRVRELLDRRPEFPWDEALVRLARRNQ